MMQKPILAKEPSEEFTKTRDAVLALSDEKIREEWRTYGCPILANYGLDWGHGEDEQGKWASIANIDEGWITAPFVLECDVDDMLSKDLPRFSKWTRRACVIAARMQLLKWRPERL